MGILDRLAPLNIDLIVRPYVWDINGNAGITAYLDEIYYTAVEGLSSKYADYEEVRGYPSPARHDREEGRDG